MCLGEGAVVFLNFVNSCFVCRYVTPWNGHGYTVADTVPYKFDSISPVWLQVKKVVGKKRSELTGGFSSDFFFFSFSFT